VVDKLSIRVLVDSTHNLFLRPSTVNAAPARAVVPARKSRRLVCHVGLPCHIFRLASSLWVPQRRYRMGAVLMRFLIHWKPGPEMGLARAEQGQLPVGPTENCRDVSAVTAAVRG
jgi:hypothetical protein